MNHEKFDLIIVGSGLGGWIAGALLAKEGRSVLLLKERGTASFFASNRYLLTPFCNISEKRISPSAARKLFEALDHRRPADDRGSDPVDSPVTRTRAEKPCFQVLLPKARIDLFVQRPLLRTEWKREFRTEASRIEEFHGEMSGLLDRMENRGKADPFFPLGAPSLRRRFNPLRFLPEKSAEERLFSFSPEFRRFMWLQLLCRGDLYSNEWPVSLAAYLVREEEGDPPTPVGEAKELEKKIETVFSQCGGRVEEIEGLEKAAAGWRRDVSLSLTGDRRTFRSARALFNSPLHSFRDLQGEAGRILSKWRERIEPRYVRLFTFFGIREKVVPVGMKDLVVSVLDPDKPPEGGNLLMIALSSSGDESQAPEGRRGMIVQSLLPFAGMEDLKDEGTLSEHLEGVTNHLKRIIPFLDDHVEWMDSAWTREQLSHWSYSHFMYETRVPVRWRDGVVPTRLTSRLFFTGKENFPYLGWEGEVLAGRMAAKQILGVN
jgi:phytoene dehydrogenase-like protein